VQENLRDWAAFFQNERPTSNEKQTSLAEQGTPFSVSSSFPIEKEVWNPLLFWYKLQ